MVGNQRRPEPCLKRNDLCEGLELVAGALLAPGGVLLAIEERALLDKGQQGAGGVCRQGHGGEGDGGEAAVGGEGRRENDALVVDDVLVGRVEGQQTAVAAPSTDRFAAAGAKVELMLGVGAGEPLVLGRRVGP